MEDFGVICKPQEGVAPLSQQGRSRRFTAPVRKSPSSQHPVTGVQLDRRRVLKLQSSKVETTDYPT